VNPRTLLSPSYDVLIDSPIEIGFHDSLQFEVEGIPHEIVLWNAPPFDKERLTLEFAAIVKKHHELFGSLPYRRYIFMIHVSPGLGGGTEHLNSTIIQVPTTTFEDPKKYRRLLGTAAHEVFHVWNVKRLRPAALAAANLSSESYTDLLWFCEGTTSYYEELILVRAGLISADEYLLGLSESIHQCRVRPGSKVQSVAESSFDAWIKFNQATPNDLNTTVSFYESGAVVSFLLDLELRTRSNNRVSMDTLMVEMVRRFPSTGTGITTTDLIAVAGELTGTSFDEFFASYIHSTKPYPFEERVGVVGLRLALDADGVLPYSGIVTQMQNGRNIVRYVLSDGPAYEAGVLPGDEIVNELPSTPGTLVHIDLIRRGSPQRIEFTMGSISNGRWRLSRTDNPTSAQRAAYSSWLQQQL
jgi:predicted metalloprotease with PDZ domain